MYDIFLGFQKKLKLMRVVLNGKIIIDMMTLKDKNVKKCTKIICVNFKLLSVNKITGNDKLSQ